MLKSEMLTPGKRRPTSSIIEDEPIVFGRETDREKVVGLLMADGDYSAASSGIQVVPICGMGGLGKTTLAQLAYNDERVVKHFEVKAWVYVSEDFNLIRLANAIVKSVTGSDPHLTNLDPFQVSIKEALNGKKFLLVLDDVWNENCSDWDALRAPLMFGARGSRILVTTRSQRVSSIIGTVAAHSLQGLSDDDCWSLFKKRAFVDEDSDAHLDLVKIGKKIVNKCKGLPLAVKTLGGLLRSVVDVVEWEAILKSEIWDLSEERSDILPALRLSYHHLPAHLKRCFAYCACLIDKGQCGVAGDELIQKWMAQGFIQPKKSTSEQMEDIGREYRADLVSRLPKSTTRLYNLQTLKLDECRKLVEVPESIGDLLQLRDLSLRFTNIVRLPKSTTRLYNLQTLDLSGCQRLVELPSDLSNLVNLRHLRLFCFTSVSIPPRIGTLKGLQTLSYFNVGKEIGRGINELKDLIHLRGFLSISELENVVNVEEAKEAQLKNKQKIDELELRWKCDDVESRQEGIEEEPEAESLD
ncbi:hypothetical protein AAC387_Pa01g1612 [Persea americana]